MTLNYVTRDGVDKKFIESLFYNQHVVIYSSAKQGKTSLRKKYLGDAECIVVSCQNTWTLVELHASILKEAGFDVSQSAEKTASGAIKLVARAVKAPIQAEDSDDAGFGRQRTSPEKRFWHALELDPNDPIDIINALREIAFDRLIVLEDFHYLPDDTQKTFAFVLKTFHEKSRITFIIIGAWREENRLVGLNGDLTNRVISIDVDTWKYESINELIDAGAYLLNITIDEVFRRELLRWSFGSVHIVREACRRVCRMSGVNETHSDRKPRNIGATVDASSIVAQIASEQSGRYKRFLMAFANVFHQTEFEMPKWIIYAILCSSLAQLRDGLPLRRISAIIKAKHPKRKDLGNAHIIHNLSAASSLQIKLGVRPLVVDYDTARTSLDIVDKAFLIWLAIQNVRELMDDLGLPEPLDSKVLETI